MTSNKKVIITGASGLIGKEAIAPLTNLGYDIYALTIEDGKLGHSEAQKLGNDIHLIPCDLFDETQIKKVFDEIKPSHLLNFAWATIGDYLTSNINFDFLKAGLDLLRHFANNGGQRAVFSGTCFEYKFKDAPLKETDEINPQTVYAKCKNHLRELSEIYCKQNNISFGWGRIFYVFGHNENIKRLTPHIINSLKNGKEVTINSGFLEKDYMYSKDIAAAFVKFLDSGVEGITNICTGKSITLADYALAIANKLNRPDLIKVLSEPTAQPRLIVGNNSKLTNEVGYKIQYSLEQAIDNLLTDD